MRFKSFALMVLLLMLLLLGGCNYDFSQILGLSSPSSQPELIKAKIHFTDGESLETYIKDLGIQQDGKVYVGGSSLNYLYDAQGNIIGSYNYQRVLYIKIVPENEKESAPES
jgi:hypothetical protein